MEPVTRRVDRGDGFVARNATEADIPAILRVLLASFASWPPVPTDRSALDFLEWKMHSLHFGADAHSVVEYEGEVIACKLRWFGRVWLCGEDRIGDVGADQAVLPGFQGRGIGRLLNDLEDRPGRPHGTISWERPSKQPSIRHMEVDHIVDDLRVWTRPLSLRSHLRTHLAAGGPIQLLRATAARLVARPRRLRARRASAPVPLEHFDQRADALWLAARDRLDLARVRDATWLNWRYADPRGGRRILFGRFADDNAEEGELLGYAVFQHHGRVLNLSDLLTHPDHPRSGFELLNRGVALGRALGATAIVAWLEPGHPDEQSYRRAGFVPRELFPVDYKVPRGVAAPDVAEQLYRDDLRRHVTMGDFDFT